MSATGAVRISICIPTFNRRELLELMARSLHASTLSDNCSIRVFDDCSRDYDAPYLRNLFPLAKQLAVSPANAGADENAWKMFEAFLDTGDEVMFIADSDLIFSPNWVEQLTALLPRTDGVLSLFNTPRHPAGRIIDADLVEKAHLGAAGTALTRDRVIEILGAIAAPTDCFDWKWSEHFSRNGVRLCCTRQSRVQHMGYAGQNSRGIDFDFADNFVVGSVCNGEILNEVLRQYIHASVTAQRKEAQFIRNSMSYRIGQALLTIPAKIQNALSASRHNDSGRSS